MVHSVIKTSDSVYEHVLLYVHRSGFWIIPVFTLKDGTTACLLIYKLMFILYFINLQVSFLNTLTFYCYNIDVLNQLIVCPTATMMFTST